MIFSIDKSVKLWLKTKFNASSCLEISLVKVKQMYQQCMCIYRKTNRV